MLGEATMPVANACNRVVVTTAEGVRATGEACVAITDGGQQPPAAAPQAAPAAQPAPPVAKTSQAPPAAPAGAPRLSISIVDLNDPVSVGKETTYIVKVTNVGTAEDRQVSVVITPPAETTPIPEHTKTRDRVFRATVRFDPIPTLAVGETMTHQIRVRADRKGAAVCRPK